jgi:hypothetical protein
MNATRLICRGHAFLRRMQATQNQMYAFTIIERLLIGKGDRTEYASNTEADACSQCKARGLQSTCRPQYDPQNAPSMSPEPDIDLRDRVAKLEAALMAITSQNSPQSSRPSVGTTIASGTEAAKAQGLYSPTSEPLYSVSTIASVANLEHTIHRAQCVSISDIHRVPKYQRPDKEPFRRLPLSLARRKRSRPHTDCEEWILKLLFNSKLKPIRLSTPWRRRLFPKSRQTYGI